MSIHTVGGVDITDYVRRELADTDPADYELTDAAFNDWLAHAVRVYSNHKPYIKEATITHVEDQDIYALPSDFLWMLDCQYRLDFDTDVYAPMEETTLAGYTTYDWPALDLIRRSLRLAYDNIGRGHWEVITCRVSYTSGKYLIIYPAPNDSVNTFTIRYACAHPLSGTDYHTIPPAHATCFAELLVAAGLRRRASQFLTQPMDYDAGQTRVRRGSAVEILYKQAEKREAAVWNGLRSPTIAVG